MTSVETTSARTLPIWRPQFQLRPASGERDVEIANVLYANADRAEKVTGLLAAALITLEGDAVSSFQLDCLSSGVREWLLQQVASQFVAGAKWYETQCVDCEEKLDFTLDLKDLPISQPGEGFPVSKVELATGTYFFQAPNGHHEKQVTGDTEPEQLVRLISLNEEGDPLPKVLSEEDMIVIETAVEEMAPEAVTHATVRCHACKCENDVLLDPLQFAFPAATHILREVHQLASAYGWSETEILQLPKWRREIYLSHTGSNLSRGRSPRARGSLS